MLRLIRRGVPVLVAGLLAALASEARACPFCGPQGTTLANEVNQAPMVLFGTLTNAKRADNPVDFADGTTDLLIEQVVKKPSNPAVLGDGKKITLPRYVEPMGKAGEYKYLVFCDVFQGKLDPYRGVAVRADADMAKYLDGATKLKDAPAGKRLRFFFDFLDNPDAEISTDAFKEFANADYRDYQGMAKDLPPEKLVKWLNQEGNDFRIGLYASLLGHCGKPEHAKELKNLLEAKKVNSGVDGILAAYVMLQPKEGHAYIQGILKDTKKDFMLRYAALRSVRFFYQYRPDLVSKKDCAEDACLLLPHKDMADLGIEDLRKWTAWDKTDRVLAVKNTPAFEVPIVRRAVLRYCLQCPEPAAKKYVEELRSKDPEGVKDAEQILEIEATPPPAPPTPPAKDK